MDKVYEVQLGKIADGAKRKNIDYDAPQIILVEADYNIEIEEIERVFANEIQALGCDCVYGITPLKNWELSYFEYYKTLPRYNLFAKLWCGN